MAFVSGRPSVDAMTRQNSPIVGRRFNARTRIVARLAAKLLSDGCVYFEGTEAALGAVVVVTGQPAHRGSSRVRYPPRRAQRQNEWGSTDKDTLAENCNCSNLDQGRIWT